MRIVINPYGLNLAEIIGNTTIKTITDNSIYFNDNSCLKFIEKNHSYPKFDVQYVREISTIDEIPKNLVFTIENVDEDFAHLLGYNKTNLLGIECARSSSEGLLFRQVRACDSDDTYEWNPWGIFDGKIAQQLLKMTLTY